MSGVKILLLGVDFDSPNRGVNALLLGTLTGLVHRFPELSEVKVIMLAGNSGQAQVRVCGRDISVQTMKPLRSTFLKSIAKLYLAKLIFPLRKSHFFRHDPILSQYLEADFVIDLSAGDSFSDIYGLSRLVAYSLQKIPAIALKRPLFIFPQTLGPFQRFVSKMIASYILNRAEVVFTREPQSTTIVKSMVKFPDKVVEVSDMAFLMEPEPVDLPFLEEHPGFVGVNVSGLLYFEDQPGLKWTSVDYRMFMKKIVVQFVQKFNKDVLFVPHVIIQGKYEGDTQASLDLQNELPEEIRARTSIFTTPFSAPQLKYIISKADYFVGARMHSCIAALSSYVPVNPVSYSHKFEGILKQLGMEDLVCDPRWSSIDEMVAHVEKSYENRSEIQQRLRRTIPLAQQRSLGCVEYLKKVD